MIFGDTEGEVISVIAHDLKNPITAVRGYIELVQNLGPLNERQEHYAERAMAGLQRMENLINSILDVVRMDAGLTPQAVEECNLGGIIEEAADWLQDVAKRRSITLHVNVASDLGLIVADPRHLSQVVTNLINNAIKYNHDKGQVWVTASNDGATVKVEVRDTGHGIPIEDQPHVFERFFRSTDSEKRKVEGAGLGLAIAQAIIQMYGGKIWVTSVPEEGSTFSFSLPRKDVPAATPRKKRVRKRAR